MLIEPGQQGRATEYMRQMRTLLTRLWVLIVLAVIAISSGIVLTLQTGELLWIAIAGTVVTVLGAVSACRKLLRLGLPELLVSNVPIGGGAILPSQEDLDQARQDDLDDRAALLASALVLIGTPLQIFGYLLGA